MSTNPNVKALQAELDDLFRIGYNARVVHTVVCGGDYDACAEREQHEIDAREDLIKEYGQ